MTTSMRQPTIDKKPPWWRRLSALKHGLALCVMILCTALAVGIVVIVLNSRSCDASDDAPGMQPSKAEALMRGHLLLKQYKKLKEVVTTGVTRRGKIEPESKPLRTTERKEVSTTAATRGDEIEPQSKTPLTTKPKEVSTTAAKRGAEIQPESKPTRTTERKEVSTIAATRRDEIEPGSKPPPIIKPTELSATAATRRDGFKPESEPPQTTKPKEVVLTTALTRLNATETAPEPSNNIDVCYTAQCMHTEKIILDNMDRSVDPCDDFYGYACGGFLGSNEIPDDSTSVDILTQLEDQLQEQLKKIFDAVYAHEDFQFFNQAKVLYSTCMRYKSITAADVKNLRSTYQRLSGTEFFPDFSWNRLLVKWQKTISEICNWDYNSGNYLIKFGIDVDRKNSTKNIIYIDEPDLELSHVLRTNDSDELKNAYSYMVDIAVLLGANKTSAHEKLKTAVEFEGKLSKILSPVHERFNESQLYNPMTRSQLLEKYPLVMEYCDILMRGIIDGLPDEVFIVKSDGYFAGLENLLSDSSQEDLCNYLLWRMVMELTFNLNHKMRKRSLAYVSRLTGRINDQLTWKDCLDFVSNDFPLTLGAMYLKESSAKQSDKVNNATGIVEDIKEGIKDILEKIDWLDEKTRMEARNKATAIHNIIINPNELWHDAVAEEKWNYVNSWGIIHLLHAVDVKRATPKYMREILRQPVKKFKWAYKKATSTQVHYSKNDNSIFVPHAILQSPFFSADRPRYMYYGTIGFLIAQQLAYGFDYSGIHYDENGNLVQQMDPTTEERYLQRGQCFDEKYSNYTVTDVSVKLNGHATLSENIADTNGLKAAYTAYNNWISKNEEEQGLPGIDKTPRQLFWISAANVLCSKYRRNGLEYKIHTDTRSPAELRVNGAMSNLAEFAEDFKCSRNSTMNPTKKCSIF